MDTNAVLLVGRRKRDGWDHGTSFLVWLRPNVDSSCSEAVTTRFTGNAVGGRVTVDGGSRLVEVRGCWRHSRYFRGWGANVEGKEAVVTYL